MWQRLEEIGLAETDHHVRKESDLQGIVMSLVFQPGMLSDREDEVRNMMSLLRRPLPYTVTIRNGTFSVS